MSLQRLLWTALIAPLLMVTSGDTNSSTRAARASCCATNKEMPVKFTDESLYQLESNWTTDANQSIKLGALQGRVQVVAMFFANCTYACPIIVHDMKRIEASLPENTRAEVGFTLVTINIERDTPEALRAYRDRQRLPSGRWTLLRGRPDDTLEFAALLGVKYKREASGQFAHSNLITVLNRQGEIIHQQAGLSQDIRATVNAIERGVAEKTKSGPAHE